ncbi:uncharacterized protein [Polyergus mexicanus]|uniref:uncharacterized protein n=1 Tax=Polyergus mexicanus TaxID=615972 RepID=UPI0038B5B6A3
MQGHAVLLQPYPESKGTSLPYFQEKQLEAYEDIYNTALDYMAECLEELVPAVNADRTIDSQKPHVDSSFSLRHLPPIQLHHVFREIRRVGDCMHFLASSLNGRARDAIASTPITADNFEGAWKSLQTRYENKRRLMEIHVTTLYTLPMATRESALELHALRDKADKAISALRRLDRKPEDILNDILVYFVTDSTDPPSLSTELPQVNALSAVTAAATPFPVLLATAKIRVISTSGRAQIVRALLDQGSEVTFISERLAQILRLRRVRTLTSIAAVEGVNAGICQHATQIQITPRNRSASTFSALAFIMKSLTRYVPRRSQLDGDWGHLSQLDLADDNPTGLEPIDVIIGADLYSSVILDGVRKRLELRRFWEIEELPQPRVLSPDENQCEEHFVATHSRRSDGRYIVRLPFKNGPPIGIGESRAIAARLLATLNRQLNLRPELKREYDAFLAEYEQLGNMKRVPPPSASNSQVVYIPHHSVIKASSLTTRYQYVCTADIAKMYRQILINSRDRDYQRIMWNVKDSPSMQEFQLLTVTYGTAPAPCLALRVLRQFVHDEGESFPLASSILQDHIYVDDVIFGADNIPLLRQARDHVCTLLRRGEFKWARNNSNFLADISPDNHGLACNKSLRPDENLRVLGITWTPAVDVFQFHVSLPSSLPSTKCTILSTIAKLFDPLGWVTSVTIAIKGFMQQLWRLKLDWDEAIPVQPLAQWEIIYKRLARLDGLRLPRWTTQGSDTTYRELHGFADASTMAYAAAVYIRVTSISGETSTRLLVGKSKVAPVKPMSVPRLELSAAVLLSRILTFVRNSLNLKSTPCFCWTDSTVVLAWLNQHPSKRKTFVFHRVAAVQSRLPDAK